MKDKEKGERSRNEVGTARGDRSDFDASPALDAVRVAQEAFNSAAPAAKIDAAAQFIAAVREGKALNGEQGGASKRDLEAAAAALDDAANKLSRIRLFEVIHALRAASVERSPIEGLSPMLPLRRDTEGLLVLMAALKGLPLGLRRWAAAINRGRARPKTTAAVDFAIDVLVQLWNEHRDDPPTTSIKRGAFGGFAMDVLTPAPVGFSESIVKAALTRALGRDEGSRQRKPVPRFKRTAPQPGSQPPRKVLVTVVDADDCVGVEAALAYAQNGSSVTFVRNGSRKGVADQAAPNGIELIDASPLDVSQTMMASLVERGRFDRVIIAGFGANPCAGIVGRWGGLPATSREALTEHAAMRPAGLVRLLGELRHHKLIAPFGRVAMVCSSSGVVSQNPHEDRHLARAALRALAGVVRDVAIDAPASDWLVALVTDGWGQQDGEPIRHGAPRKTAATLRNTIEGLREEQHGRALDLFGSALPSVF